MLSLIKSRKKESAGGSSSSSKGSKGGKRSKSSERSRSAITQIEQAEEDPGTNHSFITHDQHLQNNSFDEGDYGTLTLGLSDTSLIALQHRQQQQQQQQQQELQHQYEVVAASEPDLPDPAGPFERPESRTSQTSVISTSVGPGSKRSGSSLLKNPPSTMNNHSSYLFEDDPGIMSEVETSSTTRHHSHHHASHKSQLKGGGGGEGAYEGGGWQGGGSSRGRSYLHPNQGVHGNGYHLTSNGGSGRSAGGYSSSLHDDDPGIMSEAETASTTRGHSSKQRGHSRSSRNSIPTEVGGHHPATAGPSSSSGGKPSRTVQFRHPIIQAATGASSTSHSSHGGPNLFEDDPGIMSEAETSSTPGRRRQLLRSNSGGGGGPGGPGGLKASYKNREFIQNSQKHALPVVRTPSKTLERPLGLVFLVYRGETKRALLPNEITSIFTVKALFVRSFGECLTMEFMDASNVKIYIHDSAKDIFYELENLSEIRDRTILKLFEGDKGPSGLGPGGLPPITNRPGLTTDSNEDFGGGGGADDSTYVDARQVKALKYRSKAADVTSQPSSSSSRTLPRNAFSDQQPDMQLPTAAMMQQLPENTLAVGSSNGRRMTERSKTLGPGFMRGHGPGQQQQQRVHHYQPDQDAVIASRFSTMPESGRFYTGPGSTEEAKERMMHMEAQLSQLTGMVEKALKNKKLGKKTVSFDKAVSFSDDHLKPAGILTNKNRQSGAPSSSSRSYGGGGGGSGGGGGHVHGSHQHHHHHHHNHHHQSTSSSTVTSLSPEAYSQLRGLQRTTKDLRQEVKIIRRLTMLQSMAMKDLVQDTYLKLREACVAYSQTTTPSQLGVQGSGTGREEARGGSGAGPDDPQWRVAQDEDLFQRELNDLVQQISQLEAKVEEMRSGVINKKNKIGLSDVESMSAVLTKSSKTVTHLKQAFPALERNLKAAPAYQAYASSGDKARTPAAILMTEEFLRRTPERLENVWKRCKKLTGTLVTLKRLASVQEQRFHPGASISDLSLSPTPPAAEHAQALQTTASGGHVKKESTLDDLLDALQTYSGPKKDHQIRQQQQQRGGAHVHQKHSSEATAAVVSTESPMRKSDSLAVASSKTAPPPPPPRTSSTGGSKGGEGTNKHKDSSCSGSESTTSTDSSESINSQEGLRQQQSSTRSGGSSNGNKPASGGDLSSLATKQEALESRHQELLTRQKQLQEQYERLQQMQHKKDQQAAASSTSNTIKQSDQPSSSSEAAKTAAVVKPMGQTAVAVDGLTSSGNETEESSNPEEENSSSSGVGTSSSVVTASVVLPVMGKDVVKGGGKPNRPVGRVPPALPARGNSTLTTVQNRPVDGTASGNSRVLPNPVNGDPAGNGTTSNGGGGSKKIYETDMI